MRRVHIVSALAAALLAGTAMAPAPVQATCGKACARDKATAAPAKRKVVNAAQAEKKSKGNIDDYWSPCNSDKLTDYMYCQP